MQKNKILTVLFLLCALSFTACKSKVDEAPKAKVEAPSEQKQGEQAAADEKKEEPKADEGRDVAVNTKESKILFIGAKITGDHHGGFGKWTGTAHVVGGNAIDKLSIKIDMNSVYTEEDDVDPADYVQNDPEAKPIEDSKLTKHLKDTDFFNVAEFPNSTFEATKMLPGGEGDATHTVTGDLTLHGVTKSITFPATIKVEDNHVHAKADFSINRFDFGIKYEGKKDDLIKKEVRLIINLDFPIN